MQIVDAMRDNKKVIKIEDLVVSRRSFILSS